MPNMTVIPSKSSLDINVINYQIGKISFDESTLDSSIYVQYSLGDSIPGQKYLIKIYSDNGKILQNLYVIANNTGYINYNSTGYEYPRHTEISPVINENKNIPGFNYFDMIILLFIIIIRKIGG